MSEKRTAEILDVLRKTYTTPSNITRQLTAFESLVITIISQNTIDRNTRKAFENMSKQTTITPGVLSKTKVHHVERWLKPAGLYRRKARTIKDVSKRLAEEADSLEHILEMPVEQARTRLMQFPGVGPKTADVLLLFSARKPTILVDTHVYRVAKRLRLCPENASVETTRIALQRLFRSRDYLDVHVLLIAHGRKLCRARKPKCIMCPLNDLCPSNESAKNHCT
jgi:endonuclease-3